MSKGGFIFILEALAGRAVGDTKFPALVPEMVRKPSHEDRTDIEGTSVFKRPEQWSNIRSAIQVPSAGYIRRSGAMNLAHALLSAMKLEVQHSSLPQKR